MRASPKLLLASTDMSLQYSWLLVATLCVQSCVGIDSQPSVGSEATLSQPRFSPISGSPQPSPSPTSGGTKECQVGEWSAWSKCGRSCKQWDTLRSRTREVANPDMDSSTPCPTTVDEQYCFWLPDCGMLLKRAHLLLSKGPLALHVDTM